MSRAEARNRMRNAAALWSVGYVDAGELAKAACDLLVAGCDGTALGMLAAVSLRRADQGVPAILPAALAEVSLPYYDKDSTAGAEAAGRTLAARVVAGQLPPRQLAAWAHYDSATEDSRSQSG